MTTSKPAAPTPAASTMLEQHRRVWDMPTLAQQHPATLKHLADRYLVDHDMASRVVVIHVGGRGHAEPFATTDTRLVVEELLRREVNGGPTDERADGTECLCCQYTVVGPWLEAEEWTMSRYCAQCLMGPA